jgi:hypothetical protein
VFRNASISPPIRGRNLIQIAIVFVASFSIVFSLELAVLAAIGWIR